jgi:hypothetical protein
MKVLPGLKARSKHFNRNPIILLDLVTCAGGPGSNSAVATLVIARYEDDEATATNADWSRSVISAAYTANDCCMAAT